MPTMDTTRQIANEYTPIFRAFLRDYCTMGGTTPAEEFADKFAMYCLEHDAAPVGTPVMIMLLNRLPAGVLRRMPGASTVAIRCRYSGDSGSYYEEYGVDSYCFDPPARTQSYLSI